MFWTSWSVCDGSKCPTGKQQRLKGVCCPKVGNRTLQETKENCKKDCNLTDADFQEQSPYVPPPTTAAATTIATTTLIVSSTTAKPLTSTKGTIKSTVKTSNPASTASSSSVSSSSKGNGASNASQLSRNKLQEEGGTGGGVIAGAIIGVLAVAGLSGLLAFFLYRRWKKNKEERKVEPEENGGENPVSQKPPVSTSLN